MYRASTLMSKVLLNTFSITIVDGQNTTAISSYSGSNAVGTNPCLPEWLPLDKRVTINFSENITSFRQWFPSECDWKSGYGNGVFMFEGGQKWVFNDLIVEDMLVATVTGYMIVRSQSEFADITCNRCTLNNVTMTRSDYALFDTVGSLHLKDCIFTDIESTVMPIISATHKTYETGVTRQFSMINCTFTDIMSSWAMFHLAYSENDVK